MFQKKTRALSTAAFLITTSFAICAENLDSHISEILSSIVKEKQKESGLVSIGASVYRFSHPLAISVAGERKVNSHIAVSQDDEWHLGSVTKSITATMIARLVEKDRITWNTTISDIFNENEFHPDWKDVSLDMLLTHTSGAQADFPYSIQELHPKEGNCRQYLRKLEVLKILADKPERKPNSEFNYSNVGYTIAAVMAAIKTGSSWENLIREEVFKPLDLTSAGFGPPNDLSNPLGQPVGHESTWLSGAKAVSFETDNSPIMGPAGSTHMSLKDLMVYGKTHLMGGRGRSTFLKPETFKKLHSIGPHEYAYGWIAARKTDWANNRKVLYHNGSNRFWYALLVLVPDAQLAIAVTTNDGSDLSLAQSIAWDITREIGAYALNEIAQ